MKLAPAVASEDYEIRVVGAPRAPLRDFYHELMRLSWPATIGVVVLSYFAANGVFALLCLWSGGIAQAKAGSLRDAFFFSIQTMGTIGYGAMYPQSVAANLLVAVESASGLVLTALATGLVFGRFSRATFGETPESLARQDVELLVNVAGLDDTWMQTVVAEHR